MTRASAVSVSAEVREALADQRPVVALESTIFTHGLPRPRNLEVARQAEHQLREVGVVPATVGVVDGTPTVGLRDDEIEWLCTAEATAKATVRDLPLVRVKRLNAGTTVAATALLSHEAGVRVFGTGGIGGVHHGADRSFDESADLTTLAAVPITVISSGVKSILDIPATLQRLETLNIPVVGYRTTRYPGFYVRDSGHELTYSADGPEEVAAMVEARDGLGLRSALLVANPVPAEDELDPEWHQELIAEAWRSAAEQAITGQDATPFLLEHIVRATGGRSLETNVALYLNNIAVGARCAKALAHRLR